MKLTRKTRIKGRLKLPGDKSISHRAAMIAALASGVSHLSNFSTSRDCASTLACLRGLGVAITKSDNSMTIEGRQTFAQPTKPLDCGNSGSTMRMLAGVLAGHDLTCELVGDASLSSRPMSRVIEPLQLMGSVIESHEGRPPLTVQGSHKLQPITYKLPVASAQVKSAILFAALSANGRTAVIEPTPSRDHTELLFNGFGVPVVKHSDAANTVIELRGPARFGGGDMNIPGDVSSAAYFIAGAMLLAGSELTIEGVGLNPTRLEFVSVLRSWGANVTISKTNTERNEPVGTISVQGGLHQNGGGRLHELGQSAIPTLIDELPLIAVVGSQISGGLRIKDAGELRLKETDRLRATVHNLRAMGADVEEYDDGLFVQGPTKLHGALIDSFSDHRIAMAFSIAALIADGPSEIKGSQCVDISFPEFFELLDEIAED